jgi:hypothetical protein
MAVYVNDGATRFEAKEIQFPPGSLSRNGAGVGKVDPYEGDRVFTGDIKFAGKIGFNNTAPIEQPAVTGALSTVADAPAKAVLTSIITQLAALGLIADSTT